MLANKIIGTIGQLGVGKTMFGVIWLYDGFCKGLPCYSNLHVNFPHTALKSLEDLALKSCGKQFYEKTGKNARRLLDELWKLSDNRRCQSLLNELTDIILLRSRKDHDDIYFTQQFLQIDPRIAYIVNEWVTPTIFPKTPTKYNPPEWLIIERCDNNFIPLPTIKINLKPYLNLYDSDENPYIISKMIDAESIQKLLKKIKEKEEDN